MSASNFQKDAGESGLRLVPESIHASQEPNVEKQFVNFLFLRIGSEWRRQDAATKHTCKREFQDVFESFRDDLLLFSYSLVGFDSKADLMFWRIGNSLDRIQEMTAKLYRTELGSYLETANSYLSITKQMMFVDGAGDGRFHVEAGAAKYHFVYPYSERGESTGLTAEERDASMKDRFMVGKRFPNIRIHMTHAFGFNDHEYLVSFETDEPRDFLALAEELRNTQAGRSNLRGMPIYTCRRRSLEECLDALG